MLRRRLEYGSQKVVLQYMDPNVRLKISVHMPSIRSVEKVVPLKLNRFFIEDCITKVNDTSYEVGIIRHYPEGNAPEPVNVENRQGGVCYDYDEFGFADESGDNVLLPGDIQFADDNRIEPIDTEENEKKHREDLRIHEKALEIHTELRLYRLTVNYYVKSLQPIPNDEFMEEKKGVIAALEHPEPLRFRIEVIKLQILPFDCRRKNTKPPFTCYIQLTIRKEERKQIQRFQYTKKLHEAAKHLNGFLFGSRAQPIQVRTLDIPLGNYGICRLPIDFQMEVDKVLDDQNMILHKNFPLLVGNSNSLTTIKLSRRFESAGFQNQIVRNAKRLITIVSPERIFGRMLEDISDLPNLEIGALIEEPFVVEFYLMMIDAWLSGDRQAGASLWIIIDSEESAREVLQEVGEGYELTEQTERCVTILVNDFIKVEVFYETSEATEQSQEDMSNLVLKARAVTI